MQIVSKEFKHGEVIPEKFTCNGENINPELRLIDIPSSTKSLVLIMDDPDVPAIVREDRMFDHWAVFNILPKTTIIKEGFIPQGEAVGISTGGVIGYQGPCPPDTLHRYFFKLYALSKLLKLKDGATKLEIKKAMENSIIKKAELIGLYEQANELKTVK